MKNKSIKINMFLNLIKTFLNIVFPLITFPYASKILGVDNIGKYNFSSSIIVYATLLADLGINTYATRECSKCRNDSKALNRLANELFTINIISTLISYVVLYACIFAVKKFNQYQLIIGILSIGLICKTIGTDWLFTVFEDYWYITVRTLFFQVGSLVLLFLFVKTQDDLIAYSIITVIANSGAGILNFFYARKYCSLKITTQPRISKHIVPILLLFGMSATVTIYVASDTTILGFVCDDTTLGVYYISSKVYSIAKAVLSAVLIVSVPRLSQLWGEKQFLQFTTLLSNVYKTLLSFTIPAVVGLIVLREDIVLILSTTEFIKATTSLGLLSIALFFCMGAWFWGQNVLVVAGQEQAVFSITVISAITNIILNFFLIPIWQETAAALTTIIAEATSYIYCMYQGRKITGKLNIINSVIKVLVGSTIVFLICKIVRMNILGSTSRFVLATLLSLCSYFAIEVILRNEVFYDIYNQTIQKMKDLG